MCPGPQMCPKKMIGISTQKHQGWSGNFPYAESKTFSNMHIFLPDQNLCVNSHQRASESTVTEACPSQKKKLSHFILFSPTDRESHTRHQGPRKKSIKCGNFFFWDLDMLDSDARWCEFTHKFWSGRKICMFEKVLLSAYGKFPVIPFSRIDVFVWKSLSSF